MQHTTEKANFKYATGITFGFVLVLWVVKFLEYIFNTDFNYLGIYPRMKAGSIGILTGPLIHNDFYHLFSNTLPLLVLGICTLYFYKQIAYQVFCAIYLFHGIGVWFIARPSYHIGASGLVYGLVSFIFFSGVLRRDRNLLAISLLVIFLYGGMIWGILPIQKGISWESHLIGGIVGLLCAVIYRNSGPKPKRYEWEEKDYQDSDDDIPWDYDKKFL
ncbi:rhomboid family intramembrane serine protease [Candidatus Amoebophilus asiaticus]|nr:rhomboid family intramembrane serine protease [Candidatus Amoebophilus asiaticus]